MPLGAARTYAIRTAAFSAAMFAANGIYLPFFPIWLAGRELTPGEISVILALPFLVRILLSPALVGFADRLPSLRAAALLYALLAAAFLAVPYFADGFWLIFAFTGLSTLFWSALGPFVEASILYGVRQHGIDYARVRGIGSAGFVVGSLIAATAAQRFSGDTVLVALVAAYVLAAVLALLSPRIPAPPTAAEKFGLKKAFSDPTLRRALAAGCLVLGSHGVFYTFGTLFWQSVGFSQTLIGLLWAFSVCVEVTLFSFATRLLPRWGARRFILAGCVGAFVRWALFPFATDPIAALALQCLHGATFGMTHLGIMMAIGAIATPGHTARLQAAYQFSTSTMLALVMLAGGPLFSLSPTLAFLAAAAMALPAAWLANGLTRGLQPQSVASGGDTRAAE